MRLRKTKTFALRSFQRQFARYKDLIDRFYAIFPEAKVKYLTGDREFVGKEWLTYLLLEPKIPFCLRIRNSDQIDNGRRQLRASIVFAHLKPGQIKTLSGKRLVWGQSPTAIPESSILG